MTTKFLNYLEKYLNNDIIFNIIIYLGPNEKHIQFHKELEKILWITLITKFYNYYKKNLKIIKRKNNHIFFI